MIRTDGSPCSRGRSSSTTTARARTSTTKEGVGVDVPEEDEVAFAQSSGGTQARGSGGYPVYVAWRNVSCTRSTSRSWTTWSSSYGKDERHLREARRLLITEAKDYGLSEEREQRARGAARRASARRRTRPSPAKLEKKHKDEVERRSAGLALVPARRRVVSTSATLDGPADGRSSPSRADIVIDREPTGGRRAQARKTVPARRSRGRANVNALDGLGGSSSCPPTPSSSRATKSAWEKLPRRVAREGDRAAHPKPAPVLDGGRRRAVIGQRAPEGRGHGEGARVELLGVRGVRDRRPAGDPHLRGP